MDVILKLRNENLKEIGDFNIVIENPKDSLRHGDDWVQKMAHDYGYIHGTVGDDGDEMDCFIGPNESSDTVYVVEQNNGKGEFDEHKIMIGFSNMAEAKDAYLANYPEEWEGLRNISELPVNKFWDWYDSLNKKENSMQKQYKFSREGSNSLLQKGINTYGSPKSNSCECPKCYGGGRLGLLKCNNCKGSGKIENKKDGSSCDSCNGTGKIKDKECKDCNGTGYSMSS